MEPNPQRGSDRSCLCWTLSSRGSCLPFPALTALKIQQSLREHLFSLPSAFLVHAAETHSGLHLCYTAHLECAELVAGGRGHLFQVELFGEVSGLLFFVRTLPLPRSKQYTLGYLCMVLCVQLFHSSQVEWKIKFF